MALVDQSTELDARSIGARYTKAVEVSAQAVLQAGLDDILTRRTKAADRALLLDEAAAEQQALIRHADDVATSAELDALAEMEVDPSYTPGKNEAARKDQRQRWLDRHDGYRQALRELDRAQRTRQSIELEQAREREKVRCAEFAFKAAEHRLRLIAAALGIPPG